MDCLAVKGRAPKTGYDRGQFGSGWTSSGPRHCDSRNRQLAHDLQDVVFKPGTNRCVVLSGTLAYEPYTGQVDKAFRRNGSYAQQLDAEHIVALGDGWQKGAQQWPAAKRERFANDPLNLMMTDPSQNRSHGDGDAATWLPPNKRYRCGYVATQLAVKAKYGLWVTQAEHAAVARVLGRCPGQRVPRSPDPVIVPPLGKVTTWTR